MSTDDQPGMYKCRACKQNLHRFFETGKSTCRYSSDWSRSNPICGKNLNSSLGKKFLIEMWGQISVDGIVDRRDPYQRIDGVILRLEF